MFTDGRMRKISKEGKSRVTFLHVDFWQKHILESMEQAGRRVIWGQRQLGLQVQMVWGCCETPALETAWTTGFGSLELSIDLGIWRGEERTEVRLGWVCFTVNVSTCYCQK